jgi:CPA1 family monovalent cation:H+ antiporter
LFSLGLSIAIVVLGKLGFDSDGHARHAFATVQFDRALLDSMLSFLLFAGTLQVDLREFVRRASGRSPFLRVSAS